MRIKSQIWVQAYIRACASQNIAALVVHHGDDDAGAIHLRINRLDGTSVLISPAPAGLDGVDQERRFEFATPASGAPDEEVESRVLREVEFDPDIWIIEVEDPRGRHFLSEWNAPKATV